jgi:hypothetical protein
VNTCGGNPKPQKKKEEDPLPNPQPDQPLWLPEGSVRSIIALGLVAALIYGVTGVEELAAAVVGYYFGTRTN